MGVGLELCVALTACLAIACSSAPPSRPDASPPATPVAWSASIDADHPLVGRIWSSSLRDFVTPEQLVEAIAEASPLLLGERHDHPDHHELQAWIVRQLAPGAIVGFEMLDEEDAEALEGATDAASMRALTRWDQSGWPAFSLYEPVATALFEGGHTPRALHPARVRLRALVMAPATQPDSQPERQESRPSTALSPSARATLEADIERSHCGYANAAMVDAMVRAQEFKDRWMLRQLMEGAPGVQRVVIAGNGHVRKDYGIPSHSPPGTVSVGILEVSEGLTRPEDYGAARFDYVWFTPRLDNVDPCVKFKEALEQMKRNGEGPE